jgi:hypothetical protein
MWLRDYIKNIHTVKKKAPDGKISDDTFKLDTACIIPESTGSLVQEYFVDGARWALWRERVP